LNRGALGPNRWNQSQIRRVADQEVGGTQDSQLNDVGGDGANRSFDDLKACSTRRIVLERHDRVTHVIATDDHRIERIGRSYREILSEQTDLSGKSQLVVEEAGSGAANSVVRKDPGSRTWQTARPMWAHC